jgi:hypothetical protein
MRFLALFIAAATIAAAGWQHLRYRNARRGPVQDQQSLLYGSSVFHVLTFVAAGEGADPMEPLRKLRVDLEGTGQAKMVYAGRSAPLGLSSSQLGEAAWDAVVLVQYPSRGVFDSIASSSSYQAALAKFSKSYSHGLDRGVLLNLGLPVALLGARIYDVITRKPNRLPFQPAPLEQLEERTRGDRFAELDSLRQYSEDALVVVNLLKNGTAEQQSADRGYGLAMAGLFAEGVHGPMHFGKAVRVEGDAEFDRVALVYYPGIDYMQRMIRSTFFNGIVGGKQPGDTMAVPTVPVLRYL